MSGLVLSTFWRSGAAHRVRIALALKGLAYERLTVDLAGMAHKEAAYKAQNPQGFVPMLQTPDGRRLIQSPAILEWLEDTYPDPPLLPQDPTSRAQVRALAAIPCCDIHPLGNLRVLTVLRKEFAQDAAGVARWACRWIQEGFDAAEALMAGQPGPWAWGAAPTLADCCLEPQIYAAISRYQFDMTPYPRLSALHAAAEAHQAFREAHPETQPGAPPRG